MTQVVAWVAYTLALSAVLAAAAWTWERSAQWSGRPTRWGWLAALAGTVTLPWLVRLLPERPWPEALPSAMPVMALDPIVVGAPAAAGGWSAAGIGLVLWATSSALFLVALGVLLLQLRRSGRRWRATELDGERIWVTRDAGPAAVGLRQGRVLFPEWALALEPGLRRLLLEHEAQHVRAGDPRLLVAGLALLSLMPWNPVLWLQLVRLRNAIELDCDARVLRGGADPARYGSLLLEVGRHRSGLALVMTTFAEPHVLLEERVRRIARWPLERRPRRAAALAVVALALGVTALSARDPLRPATAGGSSAGSDQPGSLVPAAGPVGSAALAPAAGSGPEGAAVLAPAATPDDPAALMPRGFDTSRAAALMPAGSGGGGGAGLQPVAVDTPPPTPTLPPLPTGPPVPPAPPEAGVPLDARPTFTPMTVRPELRNMDEVRAALVAAYPPLLRDAGIAGTATVWFFIDEEGRVARTQLSRTSGHAALDSAALRVGRTMEFSPALNRDRRVAVWVEIPIVFSPPAAQAPGRPADGPRLLNQAEVQATLSRSYPPLLRDAGIGGTAFIYLYVDTDGVPKRMQLSRSSGHAALDEAALQVAAVMRFEEPKEPVWLEIPVVFTVR
jgi:TonB family protein